MRATKRLVSLLLALTMVFSLVPAALLGADVFIYGGTVSAKGACFAAGIGGSGSNRKNGQIRQCHTSANRLQNRLQMGKNADPDTNLCCLGSLAFPPIL